MSLEPRSYAPAETVPFDAADLPARPAHRRTLLVRPEFFDVRYRINPHMGGRVDRTRATAQWHALREIYGSHGEVCILDPAALAPAVGDLARDGGDREYTDESEAAVDGSDQATNEAASSVPSASSVSASPASPAAFPDLVFCANHGVGAAEGESVVLASMATAERAGEPAYLAAWCHEQGYDVRRLPDGIAFEGTGDAIWHPGKRLLWGGYGLRTDRRAYDALAAELDVPILELELSNPYYYHLDVCFAPLDAETVLIQPDAFTETSQTRIASVFDRVLRAPAHESIEGLACNCHSIDGETVVLGAGTPETTAAVADAGFEVREVATDEFLKAGGSVRCLTLTLP